MSRPRIHADFNRSWDVNGDPDRYGVRIGDWGAIRDLGNAGLRLAEGMLLTLYMDDGDERIELDVTVVFDRAFGYWIGEADFAAHRFIPITAAPPWRNGYRCLGCGTVQQLTYEDITQTDPLCANCGLSWQAPIAPPEDWIDPCK